LATTRELPSELRKSAASPAMPVSITATPTPRPVMPRFHSLSARMVLGNFVYSAPELTPWLSPVIAGLLLAIPLAQWSASPAAGRTLRRMKLLLVPEENRPPDILLRANALVETFAAGSEAKGAFATLFSDPALVTAHRALLGAPAERKRGEIDAALVIGLAKLDDCVSLSEADAMLSGREKMAVLNDPRGLDRLTALAKVRG